jgi:hypothetical protein
MLDDLRNHDALPSEEEQRWMALDDLGMIARAFLLAAAALAIGWGASALVDAHDHDVLAAAARR